MPTSTTTTTFTVAFNGAKSDYELHASTCQDLNRPKYDGAVEVEGATAAEAAERFAAGNDGCWIARTHACAKRVGR